MKLLFVTGSLVHGGAERHTVGLLNSLAQRGHECHARTCRTMRASSTACRARRAPSACTRAVISISPPWDG